jgi:hypothetical protein
MAAYLFFIPPTANGGSAGMKGGIASGASVEAARAALAGYANGSFPQIAGEIHVGEMSAVEITSDLKALIQGKAIFIS